VDEVEIVGAETPHQSAALTASPRGEALEDGFLVSLEMTTPNFQFSILN